MTERKMSSKLAKSFTPKYILKEINTNRNKIKNIYIFKYMSNLYHIAYFWPSYFKLITEYPSESKLTYFQTDKYFEMSC